MEVVIEGLKRDANRTWYLHNYINKATADRIYDIFREENNKPEIYPVHTSPEQQEIHTYLTNYGLPTSFYPIENVSWLHALCLYQSSLYQNIKTKIDREIQVGRVLNDVEKNELKPIIDNIAICLP